MEKLKILPEMTSENQLSQNDCQTIVNCPIHGDYPKYYISPLSGRKLEQSCPKCADIARAEKEAEDRKREFEIRVARYKALSCVPKRHQGKSFADIDLSYQKSQTHTLEMSRAVKVVQGFLKTWPDRLANGASGFLCGDCGTGKTMLACMMVENVINQGCLAKYTTAWDMIQYIRRSYKTGESVHGFIRDYINPDLLVIDEIGVQNGSKDERVLMYQVIDGRYNEVKPTVLISNSKNPVEDGFLDMRTIDRLNEGGGFSITFNGQSYRK